MIEIAIDDKACVSCSLCAEVCPTDVLTFVRDQLWEADDELE